ncbi:peptidyl-prolyl cis-trans isomerase D [Neocloeon triangulifer]|uniref:peptidyl-prolyl cis-trans isomerase D n=1 Tax=Neocloeon triangulifer TaxID=2078957 RepID=UPI00286EEAC4|nr:peptidyl-prolyl cis-trans isomerase D [Neocloeon triangulifer]
MPVMSASGDDNPIVFLDVVINEDKVGRIVIELFKHQTPVTAENFRCLCTGEKGVGNQGHPLHLKGTIFHKAIIEYIVQGGDIVNFDGTGGESIYGLNFKDENFFAKHDQPGLLSMANSGPNTNSSQFFITLDTCPNLDGSHVVFGKVLKGLGVVREISEVPTDDDVPQMRCCVANCGEIPKGQDWGINENDGTEDVFAPWPQDLDVKAREHLSDDEIVAKIKNSGNYYFSRHQYSLADRKYKKALRYLDYYSKLTNKPNNETDSDMRTTCRLNLAACKLKTKHYKEAYSICEQILHEDPGNAKAIYRRGQANFGLNNYDAALQDLSKVKMLQPNDHAIIKEINRVRAAIANYLVSEKERYGKMFKKD